MARATKESKKDVIVSVSDEHLGHIRDVVDALRKAGLDVKEVLEGTGTITGAAASDDWRGLSTVSGVASVEPAGSYQIPPPDSDVQ
jgi:methylmalonyl-CoA mutase cobalamin-binding subunit